MLELQINPYPATLFFTCDREEYNNKREEYTSVPIDTYEAGGICSDFDDIFLVGIFDNEISTIIHELNHVCIKVFTFIGMNVNLETQEAFCYLHQYLFEQCIRYLREETMR